MKSKYIYITLITVLFSLWGCNKEDSLSSKSVLDTNTPELSNLDSWIRDNFITPYNIDVEYKWDDDEYPKDKYLYPPTEENVKPLLEVVHDVWIDPYNKVGGDDFIKKLAPRQLFLAGGENVNQSGTTTVGFAEAGMKITLFKVDDLDLTDVKETRSYMHTIQHEYCHILNQTKPFDPKYVEITPSGYTSNWYNFTNAQANSEGFISAYAKLNDFEDFAEMTSHMLNMSKEEFDAIIDGIPAATETELKTTQNTLTELMVKIRMQELTNEKVAEDDLKKVKKLEEDIQKLQVSLAKLKEAVKNLRKKEEIVANYFKSEWDIDIYELQELVDEKMREITEKYKD